MMTDPKNDPEKKDAPTIREDALAEMLGLERAALREARVLGLAAPADWHMEKSAIVYTASGVKKLCEKLGVPMPPELAEKTPHPADSDAEAAEEKNAAPGPMLLTDGVRAVLVTRRAARNPRVVFVLEKTEANAAFALAKNTRAGLPAQRGEIAVRVRDANQVAIGQELRVRVVGTIGSLYGPQPRPARRQMCRPANPARKP